MTSLVLSAALKGTVLLLAAWGVTALLRRGSADLRHRVWLAALCGMAALLVPVAVPEAARVDVVYTVTAAALPDAPPSTPVWSSVWLIVWAVGCFAVLLRFVVGLARLSRLTQRAQPSGIPGVRVSSDIGSPLTWGVFRPTILLPAYVHDRMIAMAHERAHIERRDWLWQSLATIVAAILWFHPLVWFAAARLRHEAEQAVDDAVIASGTEPERYAEQLLEVARRVHGSQLGAVAMVRHAALADRVSSILDATRSRTLAGLRSRVWIAAVAFCAVPVLAAFQSRAIPAPSAPAAPSLPVAPPVAQQGMQTPPVFLAQAPAAPAVPAPTVPAPAPAPAKGPLRIGDGVSAPVVINRVEPSYSEAAREAGYSGEVWLEAVIDEHGVPTEIRVTRALGLGLDEKAIEAVRQWRFTPGMKEGQAVSVRATIAVQFRLR